MPTQSDPRIDADLAKAAPFAQPILHFGCTLAAGARSASAAARARRPRRRVEEPSSRHRDVGKISSGPPAWVDRGDHPGEAPQDAWQTTRYHAGVARRGQDAEWETRRLPTAAPLAFRTQKSPVETGLAGAHTARGMFLAERLFLQRVGGRILDVLPSEAQHASSAFLLHAHRELLHGCW